jgi:hypothetical protein
MFRYLPLVGLACLAVAAAAVATMSKQLASQPPPGTDASNRLPDGRTFLVKEPVLRFHAAFSVN